MKSCLIVDDSSVVRKVARRILEEEVQNTLKGYGRQRRIGEIVAGNRSVTADTGLRLSRFFGMSDEFWIGLQMDFDTANAKDKIKSTLAKIRPWNRPEVVKD